jgi:hypothetical protein
VNASLAQPLRHAWLYRALALLGVLAALLALALVRQHLVEPDEFSFRFAARGFVHGQLVINDAAFQAANQEAAAQGGQYLRYVNAAPGRWAFEHAPGYVFFLLPFEAAGLPWLGNVLLFLALAATAYALLARLKDEKTAALGTLLLVFTPALLEMTQRPYMDSLAAAAFPAIGGALYILYLLHRDGSGHSASAVFLFLAGFFLAFGVVVRYANGLVALVFLLHFIFTGLRRRGRGGAAGREALFLGLGALLPLAGLFIYNWAVFGAPFSYGYRFSPSPPRFAYDYLWTGHAREIIKKNLAQLWAALLVAYPLLIPALSAFALTFAAKLAPHLLVFRDRSPKDNWPELPGHLLWLLAGWFVAVYGLYAMYEGTANTVSWNLPYIVLTRFYLPGLFPLVVMGALLAGRMPPRLLVTVTATAAALGILFFAMSAATAVVFQPPTVTVAALLPMWGRARGT